MFNAPRVDEKSILAGGLDIELLQRCEEGPDEGSEVFALGQSIDVVDLGGEFGGAEDDEVVQFAILQELFGVGTLQGVFNLVPGELSGLLLIGLVGQPEVALTRIGQLHEGS